MQPEDFLIRISIDEQRLQLEQGGRILMDVAVATAANGPGELQHSECTPRGWHVVRAKIGAGCAPDTVFVGRRPTGEIYTPALKAAEPGRDWMLTRILWLSGLERGRNRLGNVDSMRRYIYIHGCPDTDEMGVPSSHGCVKMRNDQVIELFDHVPVGTRVQIQEAGL
jgi:lipoprotein-anchoring transpeptidase ErfK/SrfK